MTSLRKKEREYTVLCRCWPRRRTCGSWLACDPGDSVCLSHRSDAIAGKPAPTFCSGFQSGF
ncbi:hypothetical protein FIV38_02950 [Pseudomonas proteolytica]|nr:hypothetical protein F4W61_00815 [Pseudomonas proteolytica]QHG26217.1 hypothetical protein GDV60_26450 [Pseudomonas sp. DTU12.1]TWR85479.1 hypothetical protein FIV38_02950 [Pseudomonas proteolytica]